MSDDGTPSLWNARMFVTVSDRLPSNWVAEIREDGRLELALSSWLRPGFWEDFFNAEPDAIATYNKELSIMRHEADVE